MRPEDIEMVGNALANAISGKGEKRRREEEEEEENRKPLLEMRASLANLISAGEVTKVKQILNLDQANEQDQHEGEHVNNISAKLLMVLAEPDGEGNTLLHCVPQQHVELLHIVLSTDGSGKRLFLPDVNAANYKGETRAHLCESKEDVIMLTGPTSADFGFRFDLLDNEGRTPSQLVQEKMDELPRLIDRIQRQTQEEAAHGWVPHELPNCREATLVPLGCNVKVAKGEAGMQRHAREVQQRGARQFGVWKKHQLARLRARLMQLPGAKQALEDAAASSFQAHVVAGSIADILAAEAAAEQAAATVEAAAEQAAAAAKVAAAAKAVAEAAEAVEKAAEAAAGTLLFSAPSRLCGTVRYAPNGMVLGTVRLFSMHLEWKADWATDHAPPLSAHAPPVQLSLRQVHTIQSPKASKPVAKFKVNMKSGEGFYFDLTDANALEASVNARDTLLDALHARLEIVNGESDQSETESH